MAKIKSESLDYMIFVGEKSLRKTVSEFLVHYYGERNHQGLDNCIPFPDTSVGCAEGKIKRKERLGGLLKYYYREAA
ncbi:MAG: hypothetical protein A2017_11555 [Lentisphaerae bacterium GWF2_44_16]|nr:MAG: hypothetical protein A2017_11555 [Lentisphaerae bacterium GWF2_44_16]